MIHLVSIAMLLAMISPQDQNLPSRFYQIPEPVRENATLIISGTYHQGGGPCIRMPDGTTRWYLDSYFTIRTVYRGQVNCKFIRINMAMLPKSRYVEKKLRLEHEYLVLLRPGEEAMQKIRTAEGISFFDALNDEQIVAIVDQG